MKVVVIKNYPRFIFAIVILVLIIFSLFMIFYNKKPKTEEVSAIPSDINYEIVLNGDETIYLYKNQEYDEQGYNIVDSNGHKVDEKVNIENNVDITKTGEYEIKYTIQDTSNSIIRKVIVKDTKLLKSGEKSKNSLPILMYHYFYDKSKNETGKNANWIEISDFEEQLKYLKDNNFYFPTWSEVADFVDGKIDIPKNSVVITMDDGQKSLYNYAIPLLDKYNIPATAFIITSKFDDSNLEKYKNSTISFQSHSNNMHRAGGNIGHGGIFTALSIEEGSNDLKESIKKLGGNNDAFAYPYGDYTSNCIKSVKNAGFKVAVTTENKLAKPGMDKYALPRVRMYQGITINGFASSL